MISLLNWFKDSKWPIHFTRDGLLVVTKPDGIEWIPRTMDELLDEEKKPSKKVYSRKGKKDEFN